MISSNSNPRVKQVIQWQNRAKERKSAGIFLTEGFKLFGEAPEAALKEVYIAESALEKCMSDPMMQEKLQKTGYEVVADDVFARMSDTKTPQGILCVIKQPTYTKEQLFGAENPLLLCLENLQDPGNLGTVMRTGEAAGVTGIVMSEGTVDLFNPKVIRATMGSIFRVPFIYVENFQECVKEMKRYGIKTYAAHLEGEADYDGFSYLGGTAFLIGNEGNGLTRETADLADSYLKIPMEGKVESLNAAIASCLLMYEAHRQRKRGAK